MSREYRVKWVKPKEKGGTWVTECPLFGAACHLGHCLKCDYLEDYRSGNVKLWCANLIPLNYRLLNVLKMKWNYFKSYFKEVI